MDICSITVRNVDDAEVGRAEALRRFLLGHARSREQYLDWLYNEVIVEGKCYEDPGVRANAWIAEQNCKIKILKEHPFVSCEDGMYRVDVMYTICM